VSKLKVENLVASYGRTEVLHGVSFEVAENEIVALIGPNGAGKSTLLNSVAGLHRGRGEISLDGARVESASPRSRVRHGLVLAPEGRQVFGSLTVKDNLMLGAYSRGRARQLDTMSEVLELFPRLAERSTQVAGTLSGGEQQMLAIGRALMSRPEVLLLDEPSLGLAPQITATIMDKLRTLRAGGLTIVLVEQNAKAALRLADRAYLLETGTVRLSGDADALANDPAVLASYLGAPAGAEQMTTASASPSGDSTNSTKGA
jgi:branched-chain amino acid transport system ATP-binding protein